jgi:hypothetical protein
MNIGAIVTLDPLYLDAVAMSQLSSLYSEQLYAV